MKSALVLTGHTSLVERFGDEIEASSEISFDMSRELAASRLLQLAALQADMHHAYAVRHVRSFTREPMEARSGDWLIACMHGQTHVGCVGEIMEVFLPGRSVLRMLLREARRVEFEDPTRGCVISVSREQAPAELYVCVESAALHEVLCDNSHASVITYNYIF